jgi:hypothetical protein
MFGSIYTSSLKKRCGANKNGENQADSMVFWSAALIRQLVFVPYFLEGSLLWGGKSFAQR